MTDIAKNDLTNMTFDEVSLVDVGAHQGANVVLYKRHEEENGSSPLSSENEGDTLTSERKESMAERVNKSTVDEAVKEVEEVDETSDTDDSGLDDRIREIVNSMIDEAYKESETNDAIEASSDDTEEEEPEVEKIMKMADPEVQTLVKSLRAEAEEAKTIAKAERDARLNREFISKAESEMPDLPGSTEDTAELLKRAYNVDVEFGEALEDVFKASSQAIGESDIFKEYGSDAEADTEAMGKVEGIAKALREADPDLTDEQAFSKALDTNPDLYAQHRREEI
tara:strand:- start:2344 stop:3189 length:846 start_codon:yes stop_codon:yes gene_type:complete